MRKMKKYLAFTMLAAMMAATGCSSGKPADNTTAAESKAETAETADAENNKTDGEEETLPDIWVKEEIVEKKKDAEILVVSFGTSYNDSREVTIGGIEDAIASANREYPVRRAFTSQIIIKKLMERDNLEIDDVKTGFERALANGVTTIVVQPTHIMDGYEYTELAEELAEYQDKFEKTALGAPLLTSDEDFEKVVKVLAEDTADFDNSDTAIVFMGHGTESKANSVYAKLQDCFAEAGHENYFIGTVEAEPSIDDVIAAVKANPEIKKVVLQPLMVVCGDHANNDMAGDEEDSWKNRFEAEGYEVECVLKGMGQMPGIREIYAEHAAEAVKSVN